MYEPRFYQNWYNKKLSGHRICYRDTDLLIKTENFEQEVCFQYVKKLRNKVENYINHYPEFANSLSPLEIRRDDPDEIKELKSYSQKAGVGPMAGIAGFFAERTGRFLLDEFDNNNVIVENGGDIYLSVIEDCVSGIYAGEKSPVSGKIGLKIKAEKTPLGICTSAGTVGPSFSLGNADAVIVLAQSVIFADVVATALANQVKGIKNINQVIKKAANIKDISGVVIIKDGRIGINGDIEIVKIDL